MPEVSTNELSTYWGSLRNHWGGYCRPLSPIDLERREGLAESGWPIDFEELGRYYGAASDVVEVGSPRFFDRNYWQEKTGKPIPEMPSGRMDL